MPTVRSPSASLPMTHVTTPTEQYASKAHINNSDSSVLNLLSIEQQLDSQSLTICVMYP